jgi:O-antigen biosynthesis protein
MRADATVIISSRNRPVLLLDTVHSVLAGNDLPREIVVIDQSDTPHPALASHTGAPGCPVVYRWVGGRGASLARNTGAHAARHEVLVFLDDDMLVAPEWLAALVDALVAEGPRAAVTGQVAPATEDAAAPSTKVDPAPAVYEGRTARDILYTGNMAIHRDTFAAIGGFDERLGPGTPFPAAEDNDFGFRLLEAGHRICYVPTAIVYHRDWRSPRDLLALRGQYGRGQGAFYAKYLSLRDPHMLGRLLKDVALGLRALPLTALRDPGAASGEARYVAGMLSGAAGWVRRHRRR